MKTRLITLFSIISLVFTSCDLSSESNYTPAIEINSFILNGDSLKLISRNPSVLDTITVGDTVSITLWTHSYTNNLTKLTFLESQDNLTGIIFPPKDSLIIFPQRESIESIFAKSAGYDEGKFIFTGLLTYLQFNFKYVAKKPGKEASLKIFVASDANFDYNSSGIEIRTPIKEKNFE